MHFSAIDIALLTWFHNHLIPHSVPVLQFISDSTTFVSITIAAVILVISVARKSVPVRVKFFILVTVLILGSVVTRGIKSLIDRDRPFTTYSYIEKLSSGGDSSFPSGHTVEAFAVAAAMLALFSRRKIIIPLYAWAMLVAYSRMALGVHYPSDVLAGILIGSLIGWAVPWAAGKFSIAAGS
ncbi:MAG: phosphatase PAP2 family protein [bacterium]